MTKRTLDVDDALRAGPPAAAARRWVTPAKLASEMSERPIDAGWPQDFVDLAGAVPDFQSVRELRAGPAIDVPRVGQ